MSWWSTGQLELLRAAGVWRIQPGIESLDDEVLRRMRKGLRVLQAIALLREGARLGMDIAWNILAGFPGERPEDYARMARLVPLLTHLQPPGVCSPLRFDRFSPLHSQGPAAGLVDVHAFPAYAHVYDLPAAALDRPACYFSFRYADGHDVAAYLAPLAAAVTRWSDRRASLTALEAATRWSSSTTATSPPPPGTTGTTSRAPRRDRHAALAARV